MDDDLSLWERNAQVGRCYAYTILQIVWKKWIFTKHHAQNTNWTFALSADSQICETISA